MDQLVRLASWPVDWVDPAPAIARRVMDLIGPSVAGAARGTARAIFTSGLKQAPALVAALARFGIGETAVFVRSTLAPEPS
jgi:glutamate racemase